MGVDVNLYAVTSRRLTDEELAAADAFYRERVPCDQKYEEGLRRAFEERYGTMSNRVEVETMLRYYGPGYERGPWPQIYGMIRVLEAAMPVPSVIHYGGDYDEDATPVTTETLESTWAHFLGPDGRAYYRP